MTSAESSFEHGHSVTQFVERLKVDDSQAADQIWQRFFHRLLPLARSKLQGLKSGAVDAEDVLVSVFDRFFRAATENRFARLNDRDDLWQILLMLTDRKVAQQYRHSNAQKRGYGQIDRLAEIAPSDHELLELADYAPGPEFVASFNDQLRRALDRIPEQSTRDVALLKMEGYENREIAEHLRISLSSVERKLRLVRQLWHEAFS